MELINILNIGFKDVWRFLQIDVKDIPYQFNVLFPKVPRHYEIEEKERIKKLVLRYLHMDGETCNNYLTTEDINNRRDKIRRYNFLK